MASRTRRGWRLLLEKGDLAKITSVCFAPAMARPSFTSPTLLLTLAPTQIAQASANWDIVKQLAAGKEICVALIDGRKLRAEFQNATDDALMVITSKPQETLSRTTRAVLWQQRSRKIDIEDKTAA
jgi:hypothetical protein